MTILNDKQITKLAAKGMIDPYAAHQVTRDHQDNRIISYGVSSFGYDMRVADEWAVYDPQAGHQRQVIDPKNLPQTHSWKANDILIEPNKFVLCRSLERFKIPEDVVCVVVGKSTYARCGLIVNVTPLEPDWEGHITIELSNTAEYPIRVYANEGIAQILFYRGKRPDTTYADRKGKYQNQVGIVLPRMKE